MFRLGQTVATPAALAALEEAKAAPLDLLTRHATGDWGDLGPEDAAANQYAVQHGARVLSAYVLPTGTKVWVITEADRSSTCILLPDEY